MQNISDDILSNPKYIELQERASKDALSGLLNRITAEQHIARRLDSLKQEEYCAFFVVDLDDFKKVNDTLGHQAGDQAIRRSAQALSNLFLANDIVGRLGGDEFVVFLSGSISEALIQEKAASICESLQLILGHSPYITLTASVGVHIASGPGSSFDTLYRAADQALYHVKKTGKNGFYITHDTTVWQISDTPFHPVNAIPLSDLFEYIDNGVILLEMGEPIRIIYVSQSFCRIVHTDSVSFPLPQTLQNLVHPDDWPALEQVLRKGLQQKQTVEFTHRLSIDEKNWIWWHIHATQIPYDNPCPVMLITASDVSRFKENEQKLQEINARLQSAFEQTSQYLWEVELSTASFHLFGGGQLPSGEYGAMAFPEELIQRGLIHPHSVSRFREFARGLLDGQTQGSGNFVIQHPNTGCYGWVILSYRILLNDAGQGVRAVGIIENLPQNFMGTAPDQSIGKPLPQSLTPDLILTLKADLTLDQIESLWIEGTPTPKTTEQPCSSVLRQELLKLYNEDDRQTLLPHFDCEQLLSIYRQGTRWLFSEYYRHLDYTGEIHWIRHVIFLAQNPVSRHVHLFFYQIRAEHLHQWTSLTECRLIIDPTTRLFDRVTTRLLIKKLVPRYPNTTKALCVIHCGGLIQCFATDPQQQDQFRSLLSTLFSMFLGDSGLIGQYSKNQWLVFFPDVSSKKLLQDRLKEILSFTRASFSDNSMIQSLRFVIGVSLATGDSAQYESMFSQASDTCQFWKNSSEDIVAFSQEDDDGTFTHLQKNDQNDLVVVHQEEMRRPLSPGEKDVAFHCVTSMLSASTLESSIQGVLSYIGSYYHADRVYILLLAENRHVITMPYEWTASHKHSIQQAVSGMMLGRSPLLKRCMEERAPVFLTRSHPLEYNHINSSKDSWRFTAFPLIDGESFRGFLCIENSREHPADAALFSVLIPYILRERERFQNKRSVIYDSSSALQLMEIPNLRSYMDVIYTLTSDQYASLGAVCLDIPYLSDINSRHGFEYGSKLLWYVSRSLADIFGPSLLFRTWDSEFVALCPNTTYQVFLGRCVRLRTALQRRYPKTIRLGYTWSDGIFDGKKLVEEARAIMRCEHPSKEPESPSLPAFLAKSSNPNNAGSFVVFFQPKIDIITGMLVGAEALVRGIDSTGSIISPKQFIEEMEQKGTIRDMDLFVLDRTLSMMDDWHCQKLPTFPISVNLSRVTLFHSTTLASILAIQSRYPNLSPEWLEFEITESAGHAEIAHLQEVTNRFHELGFRLGLDDFGSQYANLSIFSNIKFDTIKLDRALVSQIVGNPINRTLIEDIVHICDSYGMCCIAEGVETVAQMNTLKEIGCRYAQGFYFDRPLPAKEFEHKYLRNQKN